MAGKFVEPWKWRRGERLGEAKAQNPNDCIIKAILAAVEKSIIPHLRHGMLERRLILQKANVGSAVKRRLKQLVGGRHDEFTFAVSII